MENLAYVGKIIEVRAIDGADRIQSAVVICGEGGKWNVVVPKSVQVGDLCTVFMPDAIVPKLPELAFMEKSGWLVRMSRFKGAPSEALAIPDFVGDHAIGDNLTDELGVEKYQKPGLAANASGSFPTFIPKTDEQRYQTAGKLIAALDGVFAVATLKMDGTSTTAYKYNGHFGVCSRNLELSLDSGWQPAIAKRYELERLIPDGYAIQFEVCGPSVQGNPAGLEQHDGFIFNVYDIANHVYVPWSLMLEWLDEQGIKMPVVDVVTYSTFQADQMDFWQELADQVKYDNGKPAEGIVLRPCYKERDVSGDRVSFKVINLNYKES